MTAQSKRNTTQVMHVLQNDIDDGGSDLWCAFILKEPGRMLPSGAHRDFIWWVQASARDFKRRGQCNGTRASRRLVPLQTCYDSIKRFLQSVSRDRKTNL